MVLLKHKIAMLRTASRKFVVCEISLAVHAMVAMVANPERYPPQPPNSAPEQDKHEKSPTRKFELFYK